MSNSSKEHVSNTIKRLLSEEKNWTSGPDAQKEYIKYHTFRFKKTLEMVKEACPDKSAKVLDIGRSEFTASLKAYYPDVTSLGYEISTDDGGHREGENMSDIPHIVFDLSDSNDVEKYPADSDQFDLIVYGETIEHLSLAPEYSLLLCYYLLKPGGKVLITTPSGVALQHRLKLLLGKNPYEKIRFFAQNPGHFREYTVAEMKSMAAATGLTVEKCQTINFYQNIGLKRKLVAPLFWFPGFKDSLVAVFSKPE